MSEKNSNFAIVLQKDARFMNIYTLLKYYRNIKSPRLKLLGILCFHVFHRRYLYISVDPSLSCNLRCRLCFFSNPETAAAMKGHFSSEDIQALGNTIFHRALKIQIGCSAEPMTYSKLPELVKQAHDKGIRNTKGNKLSHTTMANMIRNPKYKGYYVGNKVKVVDMFTKKQAFLPESEWVMYKDESGEIVPAIVSEEMWELANRVLEMRSIDVKTKQHKTVHQNLLTGKLWCAHCGKPYYRKDSVSPKGTRCSIWKCSNRIKNGADSCPSCSIYESEIVPILDDVFRSAQDNIASLSELIQSLSRELLQKDNMSDVIKQLNDTVATEQKKKQKLLQLNIEGKFPDSEFIRMTAECDAEIAKAQEDIDRLTDSIKQKKDINDQMEQIRKILLLAQKSLSKENIDRSFVDQFIKRITVRIDNPEAHENPVKMRLEIELNTGKSLEKSLIKTLIHRGQRSKKMIESYEKGLK